MLTVRIAIVLLLSVVYMFTRAKEIKFGATSSEDEFSSSGTKYDQVEPCCVIRNHSFYSLDRAVNSLTNNTTIRIIGPEIIVSRSNVTVRHLENVAIIGDGISTVDCVNVGSIFFISCNNVTITGVNWERCGFSNKSSYPGISFYKSSNVIIQNCSFNSSLAQAVVLSQVSGDLYINNSVFTYNAQHRGHGAAVQYTPESTTHTQTKLVINNGQWSNGAAKSVI